MRPVLFTLFGVPIQSYGVSKALAVFAAAVLLGRAFHRRGWKPDDAHAVAIAAAIWGFLGAKLYYLTEHVPHLSVHHFGASGFTWYGGLIAGTAAAWITARRRKIPVGELAGLAAAPLSLAYGIGRLGCLLAGDGTYGKPSTLPWAMSFPDGTVPTTVAVQPTPLYEALIAFALAAALWWAQRRWQPVLVFAAYLIASGTARLLIETLRINTRVLLGLTQPQLWSLAIITIGAVLAWRTRHTARPIPAA